MKIPEVRERLFELAQQMNHHGFVNWAREIIFLAEAMKRRPYIRRKSLGGVSDKPMTTAMKRYCKHLRKQGMSYKEISRVVGVYNHGRISEACTGKRT